MFKGLEPVEVVICAIILFCYTIIMVAGGA